MYKYFKKVGDFSIAVGLFICLLPVFIGIAILLFITQGNPFFVQTRAGKDGKLFEMIKFKTMNDRKDTDGNLLPDFERITPLGSIIRRLSVDEIPQLINVIAGDMSLIGPRPLLPEYINLYNSFQKRRHEVRPGITGWAQVNGRNALSWEDKFKFDVWYVDNRSLKIDIKIIYLTLKNLFNREGINSGASTTMEKFTGN